MSFYPLKRLIVPAVLLLLALALRPFAVNLDDVYLSLLNWGPYLTLGIALLLSAYSGASRTFTAILGLLAAYFFIQSRLQISLAEADALIVYTGISLLLPLILLLLFLQRERGLWNRHGALTVAIVPVLLAVGGLLHQIISDGALLDLINSHFAVKPFSGYILSVSASLVFVAALVPGVYRLYRYNSEYDAALLGVWLFAFFTLVLFDRPAVSTLMFSLVGISLIISLLRSIYDMAYRDELTGLPGRRALNERLKGLGKQYAIAMMDVDHFKKFNDVYGHHMGDEVLKMVAKQIGEITGGGSAYRYGGEEFCVVFPARTPEYCKPFLEAVRASIENYHMVVRDMKHRPRSKKAAQQRRGRRARSRSKEVSVTISIGLAAASEKNGDVQTVLKAADKALYQAKKKGRNRLVVGK
ncbi:MAG: GGDEF domain-containing protein [Gammaproteobacteria bacterium]|jgi:diguanylate cyclase (GGDEF)-like protein